MANNSRKLESGPLSLSRRNFLATVSAGAGALVVSFQIPTLAAAAQPIGGSVFAPNAYLRVNPDDTVTIVVAMVEMGQGTFTSLPMMIAEELEVELSKVRVVQAPANEKIYGHPLYILQTTGGSAAVRAAWARLRQVGATAKVMLVTAAAQSWKVPESECLAERGTVKHLQSGRTQRYGQLTDRASKLPVPKEAPLKNPADYKIVGTSVPRLDTPSKVDGSAVFGIDAKVKGMKVAAIALCPVIGGKVGSVDDSRARKVSGVRRVLVAENSVAVVADHYGAARKGLAVLSVKWNEGQSAQFSNQVWREQIGAALKQKGVIDTNEGDFVKAFAAAPRKLTSTYVSPPLAHSALEPLHCTIHVRKDACDVWLGTQAPARVQGFVAQVVGLPPEKVAVHNFLLGGGFGRRLDADYVIPAAQLAKQVDYPLKIVFSREEDIQHDAYRPMFVDELSAALDDKGGLVGFSHRFAGSSVVARYSTVWLKDGRDVAATHTAGTPYQVPNKYVEFVRHEPPAGLLTGNWRGVGPFHLAFPNESFIDELAALARVDPVVYRERMLGNNPRLLAMMKLAASKANWGAPLPARRGRGIALVDAWGCYSALVTEVTVGADGTLQVDRMVCAVDCGLAVTPDGVDAQVQGGIVYGLTAALYGNLTFERGRVVQSNYHDYQPLRIHEMPRIEVHIAKSTESPGGVGELGTALAVPSLMNAIHAATGKRLRTYPISAEDLLA
jgi:CO/xanthine dehydrogenase Mo-binding subunit